MVCRPHENWESETKNRTKKYKWRKKDTSWHSFPWLEITNYSKGFSHSGTAEYLLIKGQNDWNWLRSRKWHRLTYSTFIPFIGLSLSVWDKMTTWRKRRQYDAKCDKRTKFPFRGSSTCLLWDKMTIWRKMWQKDIFSFSEAAQLASGMG